MSHVSVLLNEVIEKLDPKPGENFVDCTLNGGGHAQAILEKTAPNGKLLGIDWDKDLVEKFNHALSDSDRARAIAVHDTYTNLKNVVAEQKFSDISGIVFDLGMSNWHIEDSGRGFSFLRDEPLDMRFDPESTELTAYEVVNRYPSEDLAGILKDYGEESFAHSIAYGIIKARKLGPITNTVQLVDIIKSSVPFWYRQGRRHCATKTFQALRIEVNGEMRNIELGLQQAIEVLAPGGRLAVITFHSLEDRTVKVIFRDAVKAGTVELAIKKPIVPTLVEVTANPKARSAKLRVIKKI